MTAVQEPLFEPGWEREPCGDGEPVRAAEVRATKVRRVFGDHCGSPSRPRRPDDFLRPVVTVDAGRWL